MKLLDALFGCSHDRCSFPITAKGSGSCRTYVVCLDCGAEFPYDWQQMKLVKKIPVFTSKVDSCPKRVA